MSVKKILCTSAAYTVVTFTLAAAWHLAVFRGFYDRIGYFGDQDPVILLGLLTIIVQSLLVAYTYPFLQREGGTLRDAARAAIVFGVFTASVQVIAAAAKHHAPASAEWFLIEGMYFGVHIMALAFVLWAMRPLIGVRRAG